MLLDGDPFRRERLAQDFDRGVRVGFTAHEYVQSGIAAFRPGVDRDMRLGQDRNTRDAAIRGEVVQVDVQKRRVCGINRITQRRFDMAQLVQTIRTINVNNKVRARITDSVTDDEVIFVFVAFRNRRRGGSFVFNDLNLWLGQFSDPS